MKKTYYNNGTWGRYYIAHGLGRIGYAELIQLIGKKHRRVIYYIK